MKGRISVIEEFDRQIFIYLPSGYDLSNKKYPVIYIQDGDEFRKILIKLVDYIEGKFLDGSLEKHILVGVTPIDRLDEYTPWFSKALNKKFHDFQGQADNYLEFLLNDLQSYLESEFKISKSKEHRKIMGYSLGALVSVYSVYKNNNYGKIASICASQWYENWINFIEAEDMINNEFKLLMISGKKEGKNKSTIHRYAPKFSEKSYEIFNRRIGENNVKMIWDDYEHHENVLNRYKMALEFLMSKK